jgi:molecular chaperone DnaK
MSSSSTETEINLPYVTATASGPKHLVKKLSRSKFEQLTDSLVKRSMAVAKALKDAGLSVSDIDEVILVGGSTRMPKIADEVKNSLVKKRLKELTLMKLLQLSSYSRWSSFWRCKRCIVT